MNSAIRMVENANDLLDAAEVVKDKTNEGKAMNSEIEKTNALRSRSR
jgi:hypothetical protein